MKNRAIMRCNFLPLLIFNRIRSLGAVSVKRKDILLLSLPAVFFVLLHSYDLFAGVVEDQFNNGKIVWEPLFATLLGGLAFFLYGIEKMSDGLKKVAGNSMRSILKSITKNRLIALVVGAIVTMVLQSSSTTTVMLVGFVQAGLMDFMQSLGVILGADIGTTVTAQLIAFRVTDYVLLIVAIGFAMRIFSKNDNICNAGDVVLGFGILFFGMNLMSHAMEPLRSCERFVSMMKGLENPFVGIVIGTVFTAIIQSSAAFIGIVIVLAQQGNISLEGGIPLILGANIGTCITAGIASFGACREAKRVAAAHVLFKVFGVMVFAFWIPLFAYIVRYITDPFTSSTVRQIANAHTIFNVSLAFALLPFTDLFGRLIMIMLPKKEWEEARRFETFYLDEDKIITPSIAIDLARSEMARMAKLVWQMLSMVIFPFVSDVGQVKTDHAHLIESINLCEDKVDFLEKKIVDYLVHTVKEEVSEEQSLEIYGMMSIVKDLEGIGDIVHRNILPLVKKKLSLDTDFSSEGKEELLIYHERACETLLQLKNALVEVDHDKVFGIVQGARDVLRLESRYRLMHLERLRYHNRESVATHEVHMELMDLMKHIVIYLTNIAKTFIDTCVYKHDYARTVHRED